MKRTALRRHPRPRVDWAAIKEAVILRDGPCLSLREDVFGEDTSIVAGDPCDGPTEFDHVTENGRRIDHQDHGIAACAHHHRLSRKWRTDSKEHRATERKYLARVASKEGNPT